jgi:hypothetical protein
VLHSRAGAAYAAPMGMMNNRYYAEGHPTDSSRRVQARHRSHLFVALLFVVGCGKQTSSEPGIPPRAVADALHAVMEADRTTYAKQVVNRLQDEHGVIKATEHWQDEKTLPLPAQMFRMGSEATGKKGARFSYSLLSLWPVNQKNAPKTDTERRGLEKVAKDPKQPFYEDETLGDRKFLTAVYPDVAVAPACIKCHNDHKDSPRKDFKLGDVLGAIVVRVPLDGRML